MREVSKARPGLLALPAWPVLPGPLALPAWLAFPGLLALPALLSVLGLLAFSPRAAFGDVAARAGVDPRAPAPLPPGGVSPALPPAVTHFTAGFEIDRPKRVANAAADGIATDIEYSAPPSPTSRLGKALIAAHMTVIDGRVSDELFYWECHRTHTVAPPPPGEPNYYCATDEEPSVDSAAVVLKAVREYVHEDASNPLVTGYWVLDDWAPWDGGSAHSLLAEVHAAIDELAPQLPAICGFGGSIEAAGQTGGFDPSTAANYSNAGCDMVGLYNYANSGSQPSSGVELEWTMRLLLAEETEDLEAMGWVPADTPLLGIDQAWSGRFDGREYEPGLSSEQMTEEARAFCGDGASSIAWYGWGDSGFHRKTQTPNDSSVITAGIREGVAACEQLGAG